MHAAAHIRKACPKLLMQLLALRDGALLGGFHGQHDGHALPGLRVAGKVLERRAQGGGSFLVVGNEDQMLHFLECQRIRPGLLLPVLAPVGLLPGADLTQAHEIGDAGEEEAQGGVKAQQRGQHQNAVGRDDGQRERDQQCQPGQTTRDAIQRALGQRRRRCAGSRAAPDAELHAVATTATGLIGQGGASDYAEGLQIQNSTGARRLPRSRFSQARWIYRPSRPSGHVGASDL